jgi:hypothetical protein
MLFKNSVRTSKRTPHFTIKKDRDQCRCRFNKELYDLFKDPRLSVIMKIARLRWAGRVARMDENCMPRRLM